MDFPENIYHKLNFTSEVMGCGLFAPQPPPDLEHELNENSDFADSVLGPKQAQDRYVLSAMRGAPHGAPRSTCGEGRREERPASAPSCTSTPLSLGSRPCLWFCVWFRNPFSSWTSSVLQSVQQVF